jgi:hypothetical protein
MAAAPELFFSVDAIRWTLLQDVVMKSLQCSLGDGNELIVKSIFVMCKVVSVKYWVRQ